MRALGLALTAALAVPASALAQDPTIEAAERFLSAVGGLANAKVRRDAIWLPMLANRSEVVGYRFFSEYTPDGPAHALRARQAFISSCTDAGGQVEPEDSEVAQAFYQRMIGDRLGQTSGKHFWAGRTAVCSTSAEDVLMGFGAITLDRSSFHGTFMGRGAGNTETVVYAFRPALIRSRAAFAAERERIAAERAAEAKRAEAFRKTIAVGTETNCGTVIQLRGPMVEVALPPTNLTPTGQSTFWSKRNRLFPAGPTACTYGI